MPSPTISIVTPCYNSTPFLERIHGSLQRQSYRVFEWVCVDDCSSDDTVERLTAMPAPGDLGMQVYQLPQNTYGPVAIAVGTQKARGDIILWLDHDDELLPDALENIVREWPKVGGHAGLIFPVVDGATRSPIGDTLPSGSILSSVELAKRVPTAADVAFVMKRSVAQHIATIENMESVALLGVPYADMGRFVVANEPVKIYHRDNTQSQTAVERISRKTVSSYARLLDKGYPSQSLSLWARWAVAMLRYSKQVHGRWFAGLREMKSVRRIAVIALWPLGFLSYRRRPRANVVEYPVFRPEMAKGLPDLWQGASRSLSPALLLH